MARDEAHETNPLITRMELGADRDLCAGSVLQIGAKSVAVAGCPPDPTQGFRLRLAPGILALPSPAEHPLTVWSPMPFKHAKGEIQPRGKSMLTGKAAEQ